MPFYREKKGERYILFPFCIDVITSVCTRYVEIFFSFEYYHYLYRIKKREMANEWIKHCSKWG